MEGNTSLHFVPAWYLYYVDKSSLVYEPYVCTRPGFEDIPHCVDLYVSLHRPVFTVNYELANEIYSLSLAIVSTNYKLDIYSR